LREPRRLPALQTTSIWRDRSYLDMSALDAHDAASA